MSDVLDRLLRYVRVETTSSDDTSDKVPSTACQFDLANMLADELRGLGIADAAVDEHAYVTATVPASEGAEGLPRLALIAHIDTSDAAPGKGVNPRIITYQGGDLVCGERDGKPLAMSPEKLPALDGLVGEELVVTDGTTLLGADDKAGVAEIMALIARIADDPAIPHPELGICFCPDEEIGHGASLLDLDAFGCAYGYTVDGGAIGELEWECFNAAEATATFDGTSIHPGDAKGRMVNAGNLFAEFHALLPEHMRPEHTEGYEGFVHLIGVSATCEHATARYIVRDHDADAFDRKLALLARSAAFVNERLGEERVHVAVKQQYRNMAEIVREHMHLIDNAGEAYRRAGYTPTVIPIRGGTDGAQLSFRGLPCPNLSTGGYCFHGVHEFIPVSALEGMVDVLQELVGLFAR